MFEGYGPYNIPPELEGIIVSTSDTLSGGLRFDGTRIFVTSLIDGIAAGHSIEEIMDSFPGISRENALAVLEWQAKLARASLGIKDIG